MGRKGGRGTGGEQQKGSRVRLRHTQAAMKCPLAPFLATPHPPPPLPYRFLLHTPHTPRTTPTTWLGHPPNTHTRALSGCPHPQPYKKAAFPIPPHPNSPRVT